MINSKDSKVYKFEYTDSEQSVTLPKGKYILECWGAQGSGNNVPNGVSGNKGYGGKGGYSKGVLTLKSERKLFIYVGGQGRKFNGGGYSTYESSSSLENKGGGGTDIRLVGGIWSGTQSLLSRIIVGGGGGCGALYTSGTYYGGEGGGITGGDGTKSSNSTEGFGASQKNGGSGVTEGTFGTGGIVNGSDWHYRGGGGGWYGGGSAENGASSGGGSGYVLTADSYKPEGYTPSSDFYLSETVMDSGKREGNGLCTITRITSKPVIEVTDNRDHLLIKCTSDTANIARVEVYVNDKIKEIFQTPNPRFDINLNDEDYKKGSINKIKIIAYDTDNMNSEKVVNFIHKPSISENPTLEEVINVQEDINLFLGLMTNQLKDTLKSKGQQVDNIDNLYDLITQVENL